MSIGAEYGAVEPESGRPRQRTTRWKLGLAGLLGIYVVLAAYSLTVVDPGGGAGPRVAAAPQAAPRQAATAPAAPGNPASASTAGPAGRPAAHPLGVASVAAFGPNGDADGDNAGLASRVLDVSADQPWYSQWYTTPEFGGLRAGTGLLLDLGQTATVTAVRLTLGQAPGADIQVRVGDAPSLALPVMASARGAGGTVPLTAAAPAEGRYVLVWFTRLPPDGHGHYQVSVYDATVDGADRAEGAQ